MYHYYQYTHTLIILDFTTLHNTVLTGTSLMRGNGLYNNTTKRLPKQETKQNNQNATNATKNKSETGLIKVKFCPTHLKRIYSLNQDAMRVGIFTELYKFDFRKIKIKSQFD